MKKNQRKINLCYQFGPVRGIQYTLSGIMGNFNAELIKMFFSKTIAKRINIITSELINNVLANTRDKNSDFVVKINSTKNEIKIIVKNKVSLKQFTFVKDHIKKISDHQSPKKLLEETIKKRRAKGLTGGLGLIRIVSEEKAKLQVTYNNNNSFMTTTTKLQLNEEG